MRIKRRFFVLIMVTVIMLFLIGCQVQLTASPATSEGASITSSSDSGTDAAKAETSNEDASKEDASKEGTSGSLDAASKDASAAGSDDGGKEDAADEIQKNGDVYIIYTSDIHCGIDKGFGYAGIWQVRQELEKQGYTTILVDDGDSIQGESIGTLTTGEAIIDIMNKMKYDVAIPGNHDFDYGMDRFLELTKMADFPYISCNFNEEGELVFPAYKIIEAAGINIGFVGVTTPKTITSSTPSYFQNDKGEYIYGFMEDTTGQKVYDAVQNAVDDARAEGADYVYVLGHVGLEEDCSPWTYADIIANTNGIDVFLDGHSHDTEQIVMKNKDGKDVPRSACGYKAEAFGYSYISAEKGIMDTNIWTWENKTSAPALFGIKNEISDVVDAANEEIREKLEQVVADSDVELTINDPEKVDDEGEPIRMIRRAETNLGDFCADAIRVQSGADVAIMNGGGIRASLDKGDVTYDDIISIFPFGNYLCTIDVTGQQILDALEWGARSCPDETGAFLHVSGMSYEIDTKINSTCTSDEKGMCSGIGKARRVKNVKVGEDDLDPKKHYKLGGIRYTLILKGDGFTAFDGAEVLQSEIKLDNQALIDYIIDDLGGSIGDEYKDPYGQGRITITE